MLLFLAACGAISCGDARAYQPPERFTKGDLGPVVLRLLSATEVARECRHLVATPPGALPMACASGNLVILPRREDVSDRLWICLFDHEAAHVRGWGGDHQDAIRAKCIK